MMVKACLDSGEEECVAMKNTIETTLEDSGNMECGDEFLNKMAMAMSIKKRRIHASAI